MHVVISGYHGFGNLGDEAVLTALVQGFRKFSSEQIRDEEVTFTVLSGNPKQTENQLQVASVPRMSPVSVVRTLKHSDALISGGGSLLQDSTSFLSPWYYLGVMWLALLLKKPVYVFGQGIGPVRSKLTRWAIVKTFARVRHIILRDEASLQQLQAWGLKRTVSVYPDPAFLFFQPSAGKVHDTIALNLRPWPGLAESLSIIARACDRLIRELRCHIVFIPMQGEIDLQVGRQLQAEMEEPISLWEMTPAPDKIVPYYASMRVALGMRLHHLVFASCAGRPWVGLGYDPKLRALQTFMGEEAVVLPWKDITVDCLWQAVKKAWQKGGEAGQARREMIAGLRREAENGLRELYEALPWREVGRSMQEHSDGKSLRVLGVKVDKVSLAEAADWVEKRIAARAGGFVVTANAELVVKAVRDPAVRKTIEAADLVVPDGVGVLWAGNVQGDSFPGRVPGVELMEALVERSAAKGWRVAFFGAEPGVADKAAEVLAVRYPGFRPIACYHGFVSESEEKAMLENLQRLEPDILFVALGAPKQERWILAHKTQLPRTVLMGVGGSFDVFAGKVKRAPQWMCEVGLEWLFRLLQEPRRFRRMLALPRFVILVLREKWLGERMV